MAVALERTQAPPDSLLTDDSLAARMRRLGESSRVRVETLGHSHQGRPIWGLIIGTPTVLTNLAHHTTANRSMAGPRVRFQTLEDIEVTHSDPIALAKDVTVSVLIAGASFGFEAAHVEALVGLAEHLAWSSDPSVHAVLDRLLVTIIPLMNPDGRAAAIRDWCREPLSDGHHGSGNAYGFLINRDFFNLSQPETRAVRAAINRFHPVASYDPHEDMYYLGQDLPETCWTPPFARPYHPEIHPRVLACIASLGAAIVKEWQGRNFNFLYHPDGQHNFLTLFRLGGRFHLDLCLQGFPALITESARVPGSQTWEDRIDQKVTAGLAFLKEVASNSAAYLSARYAVRRDLGNRDAFILPFARSSRESLRAVLDPLLSHEVLVYAADAPEPAYVVPTHQPDGRLVRALLGVDPWNHVALPPMAGAACLRLSTLPFEEQRPWWRAPLVAVHDVPVTDAGPPGAIRRVRAPRIALYNGQGVDQRHHLFEGGIRAALESSGVAHQSVDAGEIIRGGLREFDLLIVPGGWVHEIVHGWEKPRAPWRLSGEPRGLGSVGLETIRGFVESGGRYLGFGSGGGTLATRRHLAIVDATVIDEMLGESRALIQVVRDHPLVADLVPFVDETGASVKGRVAVPYYSEPASHVHGGPIFAVGANAEVLAEYAGIDDPKAVRKPRYFEVDAHTPAILYQSHGKGWAAVAAFDPGLRGVWRSTLAILSNAVRFAYHSRPVGS